MLLAAQVSLSTNLYTQTPKREAERLAKKLYSLMLEADKKQTPFEITIDSSHTKITVQWNTSKTSINTLEDRYKYTEEFPASSGCTYHWWKTTSLLRYTPVKTNFSIAGTIVVEGSGEPYYVIAAVIGGRVRVSDTPPDE